MIKSHDCVGFVCKNKYKCDIGNNIDALWNYAGRLKMFNFACLCDKQDG